MLTIDIDIARRFILGKQGLWPGRRWRGVTGTAQAMGAMEYLQLDPLQIIFAGLSRLQRTQDAFHRGVPFSKKQQMCIDEEQSLHRGITKWKQHFLMS